MINDLNQIAHYFGISLAMPELDFIATESQLISQLKLDSRKVEQGDIFIALSGLSHHGKQFIPQAVKAGAIAVLLEAESELDDKVVTFFDGNGHLIPILQVAKLSDKIAAFASAFYHYPSEQMQVIGTTGTNGKTTVTQLIAQWTMLLGKKSAVLGTLGNGVYGALHPSLNTTSSSVEIQRHLAIFLAENVDLVTMEISSHGLALGRVADITFAATIFTNISRDHLDFHHTMDNYKQVKWSLFSDSVEELAVKSSGKKVINIDDAVGYEWCNQLQEEVIAVSAFPEKLDLLRNLARPYVGVSAVTYHDQGVVLSVESSFGCGEFTSSLFGAFNVSNLLLASAALLALEYPFSDLARTVADLSPVCGRMEIFKAKDKPTVIVDYAHTPDALDKALLAAQQHCHGKLWVIFGCGGDRDKGKRPLMAQVASQYADHIIVTNDNPRTENPDQIIEDIVVGFEDPMSAHLIKDREEAITWAIEHSAHQDIILVAGKGHEDYQIIGDTKLYYSDRETVSKLLGVTL